MWTSHDTLKELYRQHAFTIPFENIDIHLGKTVKDIYNKLVLSSWWILALKRMACLQWFLTKSVSV